MAKVMIRCPRSNMPIFTAIEVNRAAFDAMSDDNFRNNSVGPCPECGEMHTWSKKDAFILDEDG